jgi:hypothetical protein
VKDKYGMNLLVPIQSNETSKNAENIYITDIYDYTTFFLPDDSLVDAWIFNKRKKEYLEPHLREEDFKDCSICKQHNRVFNVVEPAEILIDEAYAKDKEKEIWELVLNLDNRYTTEEDYEYYIGAGEE